MLTNDSLLLQQDFNQDRSQLFFDEAWVPRVQRSSHEGFLEDLVGHWEDRNTQDYFAWAENYTPDSVFQQCGIQFRMVKHVEVSASKEWWEMTDPSNGGPLCTINSEARLRTMRLAAIDGGLRADLPILMHTRVLMNPSCAEYDVVQELACNGASCGGANWAVVDRYHVGDFNQHVISHELGHVLGMADLPSGSTVCSGVNKHLMCQFTSRQSGELSGGPAGASCERARQFAATYASRHFDTAGTDS